MARGCLCLSINAKQTTSLGKEDISLFISLPSLFFVLFRGLTLILKAEGRQRDTDRGGRDRKRRADEKHLRDETSGFIFGDPERKLQIDKTLMF